MATLNGHQRNMHQCKKKKKTAFAQIILNTVSGKYFPYLNNIFHVLSNSYQHVFSNISLPRALFRPIVQIHRAF